MGTEVGGQLRLRLLKAAFVLATCFAAGLVTAGVVSGAGPLAALSSEGETTAAETTTDATDTTGSDPTEPPTTEPESTDTESTETETTETTETDTEPTETEPPAPEPNPLTGIPCTQTGSEALAADDESYAPGATATIAGTAFVGACDVELRITRPDDVVETFVVATDPAGAFTHAYELPPFPGVIGQYTAEAVGAGGLVLASVSFNDGPEIQNPDLAPAYVSAGTNRVFSTLVRNTSSDTVIRCIRIRVPASYGTITVLGTSVSGGSWNAAQIGNFSNNTDLLGTFTASASARGIQITTDGSGASNNLATLTGWARIEIQASSVGTTDADWNFRAFSNTGCSSGATSRTDVRAVTGTQPTDRRYTAAFVGTPNFATGASITMTKLADGQSNKIEYFAIAVPTCFSSVVVTNAGSNGANAWAATVVDNFIRWRDSGSGELDDTHSVTVTFTANASGCSPGTYTFASTGWQDNNGSAGGDPNKLFTTSAHATAVIAAANTAPTANAASATTNEDTAVAVSLSGSDVQTCDLTFAVVTGPSSGSLGAITNNACASGTPNTDTASVTYTPNANFNGSDSFTYKVTDGGGLDSSAATVTITVNPVNDAPTCANDSASVNEDTTLNDSVTCQDPDSGTLTYAVVTPPAHDEAFTFNPDGTFSYTPTDDYHGPDSFTFRANDGTTNSNTATFAITVNPVNDAPTCANDSASVNEDTTLNDSVTCQDVDGDTLTYAVVAEPAHDEAFTFNPDGTFSYTPTDDYNGPDSFTFRANDGTANSNTATFSITVNPVNDAPTVDAGNNVSGAEGSPISLDGTVSDVEGHPTTVVWSYAPGAGVDTGATCTFGNVNAVDTTITCTDDGTYTATLTATDSQLAVGSDSTVVTVSNANPVVTINSPDENTAPVSVGTAVNVNASFTDAGVNDTHTAPAGGTCQINWGDGNTTTGAVTETPQSGSGSCTGSHSYSSLGVYAITVTVTDDDNGSGSDTAQIVVFDPNAGFVTGGGWINVSAGSYTVEPSAAGKANFGFVSKYKPGASAPSGETEFNFNTASFRFHSDTYKVLLVAGFKAQYTGTGSVNGEGGYDFRLTAYDGQVNGGGGVDKFRIKIRKNGVTIFDNRIGGSDDMETADPQAIGGGSIVIHKGK